MIPDHAQRQAAVLTDQHAFVWASAGTGKTHTLTLRALYLLLSAPLQPRAAGTDCRLLYQAANRAERLRGARAVLRRFVLTTFTRKAAAEMLTRLYRYLDLIANATDLDTLQQQIGRLNKGRGDEQFAQVVAAVLETVHEFNRLRHGAEALAEMATELQICTLHSYAAAILRRHPIPAAIPPGAQFAEDTDETLADPVTELLERWWQRVARTPELNAQLGQLLAVAPLEHLQAWLEQIVRHPWLVREMEFAPPSPGNPSQVIDALGQLVSGLGELRANAHNMIAARDQVRQRAAAAADQQPGCWLALCRCLYEHQQTIFASKSETMQEAVAGLGAWGRFEALYGPLLQQCLATELAGPWRTWRKFCQAFAAWAANAMVRELNLVTFDEMVQRAAELLDNNPQVRRQERERLWALLVDEFQDTDPVQLKLLGHLLGRDSASAHEVLGFFVGDPKQSIYRFRQADLPAIGAFVAAYADRVKIAPDQLAQFQLQTSFRSTESVLRFVNDFFLHRLPLPDYARQQLSPLRPETGEPTQWQLIADDDSANAAGRRARGAAATVALVQEHHQRQGGDHAAYRDILVLVKSHRQLGVVVPALEAAGIPVVSSGARTFHQKPEVLDTLNLLIALQHPQDSLAVGALLRSPLFGLADPLIHRLLNGTTTDAGQPPAQLFHGQAGLPDCLPAPVRERITAMRQLVGLRQHAARGEWLRQVRAFIPDAVYARLDGEGRALARIDNVLGRFGRVLELGSLAPLTWLLQQRAIAQEVDRFDAPLGEDIAVTDDSVAAVQVMTIHKAKGLQGKFVIVFGWEESENNRQLKQVATATDEQGRRIAGFSLPWGELQVVSANYQQALDQDDRLGAEETRRLAYVAATRAEDRLVLLTHRSGRNRSALLGQIAALLPAEATQATLWDGSSIVRVVEPSCLAASPGAAAPAPVADWAGYRQLWQQRAAAAAQPAARLLHKPSQPEHPFEQESTEQADYQVERFELARVIGQQCGTLVHRYLELHLLDPDFRPAVWARLQQSALEEPALPPALAKAEQVLRAFYGSPAHRRARAGRVLGREVPVYLTVEGRAWSGVIDLVLQEESGAVVGVDYKTKAAPMELPAEYERQQEVYMEALRRLLPGREIRFEFWWLTAVAPDPR